jgi:tRNA modification GTPase
MHTDTICALATAPGVGAISVIRLSGAQAFAITSRVFSKKNLADLPSHTVHFGTFSHEGRVLDEVLVSLFRGPNSYTGEDVVEISCHGSPYIRQEIIRVLIESGARPAEAGEFTMRAFLNGKLDLSQAEAVADLIASVSEAGHKIAMQQMRGGFSKQIADLRERLIHFASMIELELDFGEEDVEFANRDELRALLIDVHKLTQNLIDSFKVGNVMKNGVPVVIAGKPNAGKSTLLNKLLNEERAIVSDIAGTTRDVIEDEVVIDGLLFRFIDTAGIRETEDTIEAMGVQRTLEKIKNAALVLYLFDVNEYTTEELEKVRTELLSQTEHANIPLILGGNKTDLAQADAVKEKFSAFDEVLYLSAKADHGLDALRKKLVDTVLSDATGNQDVVVSNSRHFHSLTQANESLLRGLNGLDTGITGDFIAMDIRQALHHLGELTGQITTDDLLGNIFSKFCIGK